MRDPQDVDVLGRPFLGGLRWALPVALVVAVADQLTKRWALDRLIPGSCNQPDACIELIAGARFHLVFNTGAAFSRGRGFGPVLGILVAIIAVVLLLAAFRRRDRLGSILLGAVAGGAVGNLIDRLFRADEGFLSGAVVDFIDVGWWPVFNLADAAVVCGVIGFIVLSWRQVEEVDDIDRSVDVNDSGNLGPGVADVTDPVGVEPE